MTPRLTTPAWPASRAAAEATDNMVGYRQRRSRGRQLDERSIQIAELLHEAAETYHQVFRITDGLMTTGRPGTRSGSSHSPSCRTCSAPRWSAAS